MHTPNTIGNFAALFHKELQGYYPKEEIDTFIFFTLNDLLDYSRDDIHTLKDEPVKYKEADKLKYVIKELKTSKPIQYILGRTEFYKCKIRVNEHVLIPRPETEELVDLIIKESKAKEPLNILDIGTGSGCIAIALKKNLPDTNVSAIDISEEALLVAKQNAILNQTKITFLQADILKVKDKVEVKESGFDIIVSNPPYVRQSEKEKMDKNVLDHEPHLALFVGDNDPLLFYNAIGAFALQNLSTNGKLYFEINEALGKDVKKLLDEMGFQNVEVKKDMSGKERFVIAVAESSKK